MIQFNLLPDVKLEFIKVQRIKRTVISASIIAAGSAFVIFALLFTTVHVVQRKNMSDLNTDIKKYNSQLKNTPDLEKILTIQNQLGALPALHGDKAAASRTFTFLQQLTPTNVSLSDVTVDYVANTIIINGQSAGLDNVNTLVDTLKYTTYSNGDVTDQKAFSGVVLAQFARNSNSTTFSVTANFEPAIFDNDVTATLSIPSGLSNGSVSGQPTNLFTKATGTSTTGTSTTTTNGTNW